MSPGRRQVIIWTNVGLLLIGTLRTNFSEILSEIFAFSLKKNVFENVVCKMATTLLWPQCVNSVEVSKSYIPKDIWTALHCPYFQMVFGLKAFITHIHIDGIPWIDGLVTWLFNKQSSCRWFEMSRSSCYRILMGWTLRITYLSRFHPTDSCNTFDKRYAFSLPIANDITV